MLIIAMTAAMKILKDFHQRINGVQRSLLYPALSSLALGAVFGPASPGVLVIVFILLPWVSLVIYLKQNKQDKRWAKTATAVAVVPASFFVSATSVPIGGLIVGRELSPDGLTTNTTSKPAKGWQNKVSSGEYTSSKVGSSETSSTYKPTEGYTAPQSSSTYKPSEGLAAPQSSSRYSKDETIDQYIVFLRMLKADGASSDGMGGLNTRSRATEMLKAAGFNPSLMENSDRANAWQQVFGN